MEQMRRTKRGEIERAYGHLGVQDLINLEYEEDPLILGRKEIAELVALFRKHRPNIIVTHHSLADTVPDHAEVGRAVHHACHCAGRPGFESPLPPI